jgi:hypothetical protein
MMCPFFLAENDGLNGHNSGSAIPHQTIGLRHGNLGFFHLSVTTSASKLVCAFDNLPEGLS